MPRWEKPHAKTTAWPYNMEGHAQKCFERDCEQESGAASKSFKSLLGGSQFKQEELESGVLRSLLTNCLEMLVLGTKRKTGHSVVCQQTCKSSRNMDPGMRQTIGKTD